MIASLSFSRRKSIPYFSMDMPLCSISTPDVWILQQKPERPLLCLPFSVHMLLRGRSTQFLTTLPNAAFSTLDRQRGIRCAKRLCKDRRFLLFPFLEHIAQLQIRPPRHVQHCLDGNAAALGDVRRRLVPQQRRHHQPLVLRQIHKVVKRPSRRFPFSNRQRPFPAFVHEGSQHAVERLEQVKIGVCEHPVAARCRPALCCCKFILVNNATGGHFIKLTLALE